MASEGELTADIVKSAIFAASDDINAKFEEMPMTWGQVWQSMQNTAVIAFQPVLEKINDLANSETFQNFVDNVMGAMAILANTVLNIFDVIGQVGGFISDNWSVLSPIIYGVVAAMGLYTIALIANSIAQEINNVSKDFATLKTHTHAAAQMMEAGSTFTATAAQHGFNAALLACPLTWIIIKIIALIAIIYAVCSAIAKLTGVATSGFGIICGGVNVVIQFFRNLGLMVGNIALGIGNAIAALCSNMFTAFGNAINSIQSLFYNLLSTALSVISQIAETLNKLPFIEFDVGAISGAADKYAAKAAKLAGDKKSYKSVGDAFNKGFNTYDAFGNGWVSDAFHAGTAWGDGIADKMKGMLNKDKDEDEDSGNELLNMGDKIPSQDYSPEPYPVPVDIGGGIDGIGNGVSDIAGNTADIADAVEITEEDLKYLRDIAEQETVNRYTIAEITIDQSGMQNSINNGEDIDGFVRRLTESVNEAVEIITEGVHA